MYAAGFLVSEHLCQDGAVLFGEGSDELFYLFSLSRWYRVPKVDFNASRFGGFANLDESVDEFSVEFFVHGASFLTWPSDYLAWVSVLLSRRGLRGAVWAWKRNFGVELGGPSGGFPRPLPGLLWSITEAFELLEMFADKGSKMV